MASLAVRAVSGLRGAARDGVWRRWPWPTIAIALVSLWLPFANYGFRLDLIGGDANAAWASPGELLHELLGVFVDYQGLGQNAAEGIQAIFPTLTIAAALHGLGLTTALVARLMIALYYFVAMAGAERLGSRLLSQESAWVCRAGALSGALLFGVNHYTLHVFGTAETYFPLGYIAMPWLLYGVLAGAERDRRLGIVAIAAAVVCAGGAAMNPAFFGLALLVLPLGAILAAAGGARPTRILSVCAIGLLLGLGACAWWVLPAPTGFGASLGQLAAEGSNSWVEWMSRRSGFAELFRLDGYVGGADLPFAAWYASPLGSLLGYGPVIVAIAGAGVGRRRLGAVALISFALLVFLAKGVHAPAGTAYQALMDHVPGFSIFRSPYDKWGQLAAIALVVIYVLGFAGIVRRAAQAAPRNRRRLVALATAAILPVVAYPWPAYAGRMLQASSDPVVTFVTSLPADYRRVGDFLRRNVADARALVLNVGSQPYPLYTWGYFGTDPLPALAGVPVAGADVIPRAAVLSSAALARAMDALAVRYIVVHDDLRNPQPSADVGSLVAGGDARLVLRTHALRVYERTRGPRSLVGLVHDPALIGGAAAPGGAGILDPQQTAQLVPNASPSLVTSATLLTGAGAQKGDRVLGAARRLTPPGGAQPASDAGVVLGNPLAAAVAGARCGRRPALHVRSASAWTIGRTRLPSFDSGFCLARSLSGAVYVDGMLVDSATHTVALAHRSTHRVAVWEASALGTTTALPVRGEDLVFGFTAKGAGDAIDLAAPPLAPGRILVAEIRGSDDSVLGDGFDGDTAPRVRVPLAGRLPLAGEWCFIDFRQSDRRLWPAIRRLHGVHVTFESTATQQFAFTLGEDAVRATVVRARDLQGPFTERLAANVDPVAALAWLAAAKTAPKRWRARGSDLDLQGDGGSAEVHAPARLLATDRYRLRMRYRAGGDATLAFTLDGYAAPRSFALVADGRVHVVDAVVHPPTNSVGRFELIASAAHGALHVRNAAIHDDGPNALFYSVQPGRAGGRLLEADRLAPWHFAAIVAGCTPCVLQIAVSEPRHWLVRGARILGSYEGAGQSTGMPWSGNTTGAATWVVDAGRGPHRIDVIFYPALLAGVGVLVSLLTLVLAVVLLPRLAPGRRQRIEPASLALSRRSEALRLAALAAALALVPSTVFPSYGDIAGGLLWLCLLLLGVSLLFEPSRARSVVDGARVGEPVAER